MQREELQKQKARDLMKLATSLGVKGAWDMKKAEVIEAILGAESSGQESESAQSNDKTDNHVEEPAVKTENEAAATEVDMEQKMPYIETAQIGSLVAFKLRDGKVKSAKIVKRSTKNRKLKLETDYGAQYIVSYDDIIWVRTGKRWPRGVYMLLKGLVDNGETAK